MAQTTVQAEKREKHGSVASRRLRRSGRVPAVVYGHKQDVVSITLSSEDVHNIVAHRIKMLALDVAGASESVLVKDVQFDTFGERVLHLDLERVAMDEVIHVECPVEFVGTSKGAAAGGVMEQLIADLEIRCLPGNIPESIRVSVSDLEIGDSIHVKNVKAPEGVTIETDPEQILVTVRPPLVAEGAEEAEAAAAEAGAGEPEVIGRPKEEDAAEDAS
jgi:large subunit ribosomal protein L25